MNLSLDSCKYRLCQIDKTVKIFDDVAFSRSYFLKYISSLKIFYSLFLALSILAIDYASIFIISLNIGQNTRYCI